MRVIQLTQGKIAIVDDDDFEEISQRSWYFDSFNGYARCGGKNRVYLHRFIMGNPKGLQIDHANGNKLDNRKENLRVANVSQNAMNRKVRCDSTTGYKGVFFTIRKRGKPYRTRIQVNGKYITVGQYDTAEEAALAYNEAALKYYGEYALLNEVKP